YQHCVLVFDVSEIVFVKQFERPTKIGVGKDIDHFAFERCFHRAMDLVLLEKFGHLADIADEDKTANLGVEVLHRVNELQHETRGIQYGIRDVAQDYHLRLALLASVPPAS